jgi:hypothetical protein
MAVDKTLITIVLRILKRLDGNPVTADTIADLVTCDLCHTVPVDRVRDALLAARERHLVKSDEDIWGEDTWEITPEGSRA